MTRSRFKVFDGPMNGGIMHVGAVVPEATGDNRRGPKWVPLQEAMNAWLDANPGIKLRRTQVAMGANGFIALINYEEPVADAQAPHDPTCTACG